MNARFILRIQIYVLLYLLLSPAGSIRAQFVFADLYLNPNPSPFIFTWEHNPEMIQLVVFLEGSSGPLDVRIITTVRDVFGEKVAGAKASGSPVITILPGENFISGTDFFRASALEFESAYQRSFDRLRSLPEGDYQLCVEIVDRNSGFPLNEMPACGYFIISAIEAPYLIYPPDGSSISAWELSNLIFQWAPVILTEPSTGWYMQQFVLTEVLPNQQPEEAIRVNPPFLDECYYYDLYELIWPEDMISLTPGTYAWGVRLLDDCGGRIIADFSQVYILKIPTDEGEPDTTYRGPPEWVPELTTKDNCQLVPREFLPATEINLGMVLENNTLFPYPRAVAIRGEGSDFDLVKFRCSGCEGGQSTVNLAIRDEVGKFKWKLDGKGTLNSPVGLDKLLDLQEQIDALLERLRALAKEAEDIAQDTATNIPAMIGRLERKLETARELLEEKRSALEAAKAQRDSLAIAMEELVQELRTSRDSIHSAQQRITENQIMADSLQGLLEGRPKAEEIVQRSVVDEVRGRLENAEASLLLKEQEIITRSEELAAAIQQAEATLEQLSASYNQAQNQAELLGLRIREIETTMLRDPEFLQLRQRENDWRIKVLVFVQQFVPAAAQTGLVLQMNDIRKLSYDIVSTADTSQRTATLQTLLTNLSTFHTTISQYCSQGNPAQRQECSSALGEVGSARTALATIVSSLAASNYLLNSGAFSTIDSLQQALRGQEASIRSLAAGVTSAAQTYEQAQSAMAAALGSLEAEKEVQVQSVEVITEELATAEQQLSGLMDARVLDLEKNRQAYIEALSARQSAAGVARVSLDRSIGHLVGQQSDSISLENKRQETGLNISALESEVERLEGIISLTETALQETRNRLDERKNDATKSKEETDRTGKELEALRKALSEMQADEGRKKAEGPLIYYIPPPLEDIFNEEQRKTFDSLVGLVDEAELRLVEAYEDKQALQGKLVRMLGSAAKLLVSYKTASDRLNELEEEISGLDREIGSNKAEKAQEYLQEQQELQQAIAAANALKNQLSSDLEHLEGQTETIKQDITRLKEELEVADQIRDQLEDEIRDLDTQLREARSRLQQAETAFLEAKRAQEEEKARLNSLEKSLALANNNLTRSLAAGKEDEAGTINAEIKSLQEEIEASEERQRSTLDPELARRAGELKTARQQYEDIQDQFIEKESQWRDQCREIDNVLKDNLQARNDALQENLSNINQKRIKVWETEVELEQAEARREELQTAVDKDEEIQEQKKELDALKEEKDAYAEMKGKAETELKDLLEAKEELVRSVNEELQAAKDGLIRANQDLRDFLLEAFNSVDLKVKLELEGEDLVPGWRTKDPKPDKLIKTLEYPRDRIPRFIGGNTYAEDDVPKEPDVAAVCNPSITFEKAAPPEKANTGRLDPHEPRSIALIYRKGKPLWPEWPVIPEEEPLLAKDIVRVFSLFSEDLDDNVSQCTGTADCKDTPKQRLPVVDKNHYNWSPRGMVVSTNYLQNQMYWESDFVKKPFKLELEPVEAICTAPELVGDEPVKQKYEPEVKAGVLIEVTDSLVGIPDTSMEVVGRVVTGDHLGLGGETIEFEAELLDGESEGWGFEGNPKTSRETDALGYARPFFDFGNGYARFTIHVRWKREDNVIMEDEFEVIAPLYLDLFRFGASSPSFAWDAAVKLFTEGGNIESAVADFPSSSGDEGMEAYATEVQGVAGLQDAESGFADEEKIRFDIKSGKANADPETADTGPYGLGVTWVDGVEEEKEYTLEAAVEEKYEPVARPPRKVKDYSTAKSDRFHIGSADFPFMVVMDEPFSPEEPVTGSGRLGLDEGNICDPILEFIYTVPLQIDGIIVSGEEDKLVAVEGGVTYTFDPPAETDKGPFHFEFSSFTITATSGGAFQGKVSHSTYLPEPVSFEVAFEPDGNFIGTISDLPAFDIKGFTLKEGTSITLDFDQNNSPGTLSASFRGIVINQASLVMPESFSSAENERPALTATGLYIGNKQNATGASSWLFGGEIGYEGTLLKLGYAGYELTAGNTAISFDNGEILSLQISGELSLPTPMEGKIAVTVSAAGEGFAAMLKTENPVAIPRLGMTMTLHENCGLSWVTEESLGILSLNATVVSQKFGKVDIKGFEINSRGEIRAEEIAINRPIEFAGGFNLHIETLGFALTGDEYAMNAHGSFSFPKVGIDQLKGSVALKPGPAIEVTFEEARISFEAGPVEFTGELNYSGSEFKGDFDIKLKRLLEKGMHGLLIIGNIPDEKEEVFNYWYAELEVGTGIPLGQTGLSILSLGGGLGYNYNPPIGNREGSPTHSGTFAFKAMLGMGNTPNGNVFAGRMEMSLTSQRFSLYGKAWLLQQQDALFGEGELYIAWDPRAEIGGYVRMFIGIPDAEGKILRFDGKVNFLYSSTNAFIRSETLEGALLQEIKAQGVIDISKERVFIQGQVGYDINETFDLGIVAAIVVVDIGAGGTFSYTTATSSLYTKAWFNGAWDVDLDTPFGTADIVSGRLYAELEMTANPTRIIVEGKAGFSYDVWIYSDNVDVEIGFEI